MSDNMLLFKTVSVIYAYILYHVKRIVNMHGLHGEEGKCNKSTTSASNNVVYKLHYKLTNNIQPTCKLGRGVHNHYMISFCNVRPYVTKKFQHALQPYY